MTTALRQTTVGAGRALPHAERVVWEGQSPFAVSTASALVAGAIRDFVGRHR